jgi:hypothetical protein
MGIVILGLFSNTIQGIEGAILLSLAHGIVSPALFILVTILYNNHGTRIIKYYSGMVHNMPIFAIFFFIFTIANCATPLTANFLGELLCFIGSFQMNPIITALAGLSMILSAAYSFWLFGRIMYGQESPYISNVRDVTRLEFFVLLPLVFLTILLGLFPNIIIDSIHFTVSSLIIDTSSISSLHSSSQILNSPPLLAIFPSLLLRKEEGSNKKGFTIYCYKDGNLNIFSSVKEAARHFSSNPETILKYAKTHKSFRNEFILSLTSLPCKGESKKTFDSISTKRKGLSVYIYCIITKKLLILPSTREAERYFNVSHRALAQYIKSNKLFKEQFILSFTPLSEEYFSPISYISSSEYPSTNSTSLTIWGENLPSLIGYKLSRYELSLFTTLPSHIYYMVIGLILSDAHLALPENGINYNFYIKQSIINVSFLLHCFSVLAHYCQSMPTFNQYSRDGKTYYGLAFRTRSLPCFTQLRQLFYPNGTKIVPENIYDLITPVSLAYWICGDGAKIKHGLRLCTDSFSFYEVISLMNVLKIKFNLDCTMIIRDQKHPRIYIKKHSMPHLRQLVSPYMHPSFFYKINS